MAGSRFQSGGDACEVCVALDGQVCTSLPHSDCQCSLEPDEPECEYSLPVGAPTYYGDGSYDFDWGGELTVTCPDGSESGESFSVDAADFQPVGAGDRGEQLVEFLQDAVDSEVAEICAQCPTPEEGDD